MPRVRASPKLLELILIGGPSALFISGESEITANRALTRWKRNRLFGIVVEGTGHDKTYMPLGRGFRSAASLAAIERLGLQRRKHRGPSEVTTEV